MNIEIFDTASEASAYLADILLENISKNSKLNLGVATGRTMDAVYYELVSKAKDQKINCTQVNYFALDEYIGLAKNDPHSYSYYLNFHLYNPLAVPEKNRNILDVYGQNFDVACREYENKMQGVGGIDIQILGVGTNGHIGLNEPGSSFDSRSRIVALTSSTLKSNSSLFKNQNVPLTALTMGIGTILEANECILIATGESKAKIIQKIVNGDVKSQVPATALKLHPNFILILDRDAAKLI